MKQNVASQLVSAQMVDASDGSDQTTGTCNVAVEIDGTPGTGGTATHIANGKWEYAPIQADTNGAYITFQFVIAGALTTTVQVYTGFPQSVDNDTKISLIPTTAMRGTDNALLAANINLTGGAVDNVTLVATTTTNTDMVGTDNAALATAMTTAQNDLDIITGATGVNLLTATQSSIDAIEADTDELQGDWVNGGRLDLILDAVPTALQNSDALLNRDMSAVSDTTARSPLNALRLLRNKWSVAATTMTVTKEDDTTSAWTATISSDAAADPVIGSDPA